MLKSKSSKIALLGTTLTRRSAKSEKAVGSRRFFRCRQSPERIAEETAFTRAQGERPTALQDGDARGKAPAEQMSNLPQPPIMRTNA